MTVGVWNPPTALTLLGVSVMLILRAIAGFVDTPTWLPVVPITSVALIDVEVTGLIGITPPEEWSITMF